MGNNIGYGQGYGNMNNFWQLLAGRVLSRAQQNIRNYFANYSKCLTPKTVPTTAKVYTRGNSQKNRWRTAKSAGIHTTEPFKQKWRKRHKNEIPSEIKSLSTYENYTKYTRSGLKEQQYTLDKPYKEYQRYHTKNLKIFTLMGIARKKGTIIMRTRMTPKGSTTHMSKFSDIHNYAANQLLKTVNMNMENVKQWAILDSGATSNFLMTDAHTSSVTPVINPISVMYTARWKQSKIYASMHVGPARLTYGGQKWAHHSRTSIKFTFVCCGTLWRRMRSII